MKHHLLRVVIASTIVCLATVGCRRSDDPDAPPPKAPPPDEAAPAEAPPPDRLGPLFSAIDQLLYAGDTNAATAKLTQAVDDPAFAAERSRLFESLIRFLLYTEQVATAQETLLAALAQEPEQAQGVVGYIYGHLERQADPAARLAWTEQLLALKGQPEIERKAFEWRLLTLQQIGGSDALTAAMAEAMTRFAPEVTAPMMERLALTALANSRLEQVDLLVVQLKPATAGAYRDLVQALTLRLAIERAQWTQVTEQFPAAAKALPDATLSRIWRSLAAAAHKAHQEALLAPLAEQIVREQSAKQATARAAAREWLAWAKSSGDIGAIPERLELLKARKFDVRDLYELFNTYFYATIDDPVALKAMMDFGEALLPQLDNEASLASLKTMTLDGSFVAEDYDRALRMLEAGIPKRDAAWHTMAITKVKAHRALLQQKPQEAVGHFRDFMRCIEQSEDADNVDPASGVVHTKEMILGRNAKRIGDILSDAKDLKGAEAAYAEARSYYRKALEHVEAGTPTEALIRREQEQLPKPATVATPARSL